MIGPTQLGVIEQLEQDIHKVSSAITSLLGHRSLYNELVDMVRCNPALQRPSSFYSWMRHQYATYMAIGIRRVIDKDPRTYSLHNVLTTLIPHCHLMTIERHAGFYASAQLDPEIGRREFQRFADPTGKILDAIAVRADLASLEANANRIKAFVDQHVAHTDRIAPGPLPDYRELNATLDFLRELTPKYTLILRCVEGELTPTHIDDWQAIFRIPWIVSE